MANKKLNKKRKKAIKIIGLIFSFVLILSSVVFDIFLGYTNVLPFKYFALFVSITNIFVFLFCIVMIRIKYKIWFKCLVMFLSTIYIIICFIGCVYINKTYDFMNKIKSRNMMTENYYIIVNKNSSYSNLTDLDNKIIGTFDEKVEIYNKAIEILNQKVNVKLEKYNSIMDMGEALIKEEIDAIIVSTYHKESINETLSDFINSTKELEIIEVEIKKEENDNVIDLNVSKEPFTIYVSGIDLYGDISNRSRSDVNMLVTINPNNHEILLTSIPRDYYVQLYDTEGYYKDKLTHAGIYGVDCSINTIEEFMNIEIDYYVRVNFSTLINVVDVIGGIDVYSDKSFVPWTNKSLYITEGMVHMDGAMALAFARERYTYEEGDRHRVQNQQDVISAIIKKVTSSTTILTKYTTLLDELSSSFETSINTNDITSLIKLQLDKMPSWTIKNYSLNGSDSMEYTYSFGEHELYVMIPDEKTISIAKNYIDGMKNGKTFTQLGFN